MITPFLTHQVTTTGDFTQEIIDHTEPMNFQRVGPRSHVLSKPSAKPGPKRHLPRIGAECPTKDPGRVCGRPKKVPATPPDIPAAVLQRLLPTHSSPPPGSLRANQNRVRLFSPCESLFGVISAERPACILGPTKSSNGGVPMVQSGYLRNQNPKNGPARHEVTNG